MDAIKQPLSNVQLEILKSFSYHLTDEELKDFREAIARYFANRAIQSANKVWEEKCWTDEHVDRMLNTKMRKFKKLSFAKGSSRYQRLAGQHF